MCASCFQHRHILDADSTGHGVYRPARGLMLCTELIDVRLFSGIGMPGKVEITDVQTIGHGPTIVYGDLAGTYHRHVLDLSGTRYCVHRTSGGLVLCTKLIDVGRIAIIGMPGPIKLVDVYGVGTLPAIVYVCADRPLYRHVLDLSGTCHTISWTSSGLMLRAKLVDVGRITIIGMPSEVKASDIYARGYLPHRILCCPLCPCYRDILDLPGTRHTITRASSGLMLRAELIDVGRVPVVGVPGPIKLPEIQPWRYVPVVVAGPFGHTC